MNYEKQIQKTSNNNDNRITTPQRGIEIQHKGKPINPITINSGYVYLLIDCSISMNGDKLQQAKNGALNFARDALNKGYFTGMISFDSEAKLICEPDKDLTILQKAITALKVGETTHMEKPIRMAYNLLTKLPGNRIMVLITDGVPNGAGDPEATLSAAEYVKKNGIEIIAIGTDGADQEFLKKIASHKDLGMKVERTNLQKAITDTASLLPSGNKNIRLR